MADDGLLKEELERVYRLYEERTRQFRRGLYGLIVASVAVFVLLVVPFLSFRDQVARLEDRRDAFAIELETMRLLVTDTRSQIEDMREVSSRIHDFADSHRDLDLFWQLADEAVAHDRALDERAAALAEIPEGSRMRWAPEMEELTPAKTFGSQRDLFLSMDVCNRERSMAWIGCRLCADFVRLHRETARGIEKLQAFGEAEIAAVVADLDATLVRAGSWLLGAAPHWKTGESLPEGEGDLRRSANEIRGMLTWDIRSYEERAQAFDAAAHKTVPQRELEVEDIAGELSKTSKRFGILKGQLDRIASFDQIGTPVGDLPVGLGQLVLLFPVVVAIGFLVVANGYTRTAELQRAFARLCRMRDRSGAVMDDRHISVIAPLWLERRDALGARAMKLAILLTPFSLVLGNLVLIGTTRALTEQLPDDTAITPEAYMVLYGLTLALFAGSLWHIWHSGRTAAGSAAESETEAA